MACVGDNARPPGQSAGRSAQPRPAAPSSGAVRHAEQRLQIKVSVLDNVFFSMQDFPVANTGGRDCTISMIVLSTLDDIQAQHQCHRMLWRLLKAVVLVELLGALIERVDKQGPHASVL